MNFIFCTILAALCLTSCDSFKSLHNPSAFITRARPLAAVQEVQSVADLDGAVSSGLVVIDYGTTWCGPCKLVAPKFEALSEKYEGVTFLKCIGDTSDEAKAVMKREGIRSVPAFHIWKDGKKVDTINGARIEDVEASLKSFQ